MTAEKPTRTVRAPVNLVDAAVVHAAREELGPLIEQWGRAPLDPEVVASVQDWLDEEYPPVAAALERLDGCLAPGGVA